jgi:hypothetical protein
MFVNGPPPGERYVEPGQCSTSGGWPVVDMLLAGFEGARTANAISLTDADYRGSSLSRSSDIAFGTALLALTAVSAGVGFSRVKACNEAIAGSDSPPRFHRRVVPPAGYAPAAAVARPVAPAPAVDSVASPGPGARPAAPASQQADPE